MPEGTSEEEKDWEAVTCLARVSGEPMWWVGWEGRREGDTLIGGGA